MTNEAVNSLRTECLRACQEGDLPRVKELIAQGVEINGEVDGWTGFLSACTHEPQTKVARYLLENGARIVHDCDSQLGPCNFGNAELLKLLLDHGSDPNFANPQTGETMLHVAACRGRYPGTTDCVRILLGASANPNVSAKNRIATPTYGGAYVVGETPLHLAAAYGDLEMIRLLIEAGADPIAKDADGHMPRFYFARYSEAKERGKIKDLLPYAEPTEQA